MNLSGHPLQLNLLSMLPLAVLQDQGAGQASDAGATGSGTGDVSVVESVDGSPETGPVSNNPFWFDLISSPIFPLILLFVVFYAFIIGGNRRKDRARKELLSSLTRGDRVTTIGGIIGSVVDASDDEVVVKINENTNTKMRFTRGAIASVTRDEKKQA